MIIETNIKSKIQSVLIDAKSIWVATAMISNNGWSFIQKNISKHTEQHFLIGIDLATEPKVFEALLDNLNINARVYQTNYTFHPKVYLIKKENDSFTAFIGSSNTTNWGLEKNIEMNFQVNDQEECKKLLSWFSNLYNNGYIITEDFVKDYKSKFIKASYRNKETQIDIDKITSEISKDEGQFFSKNHYQIFEKKYHRVNSQDLKRVRKEVSVKFKELHNLIYPQFKKYGFFDLHCHHNSREIVSRHFFNQFSGNYISAIWLHYGKSPKELTKYINGDLSINKPDSFINNIRLQVIIHEDSLGIWLVLGRNNGSYKDRLYFREQMRDENIRKKIFEAYKNLGNEYRMNIENMPPMQNIKTPEQLHLHTQKESIDNYFIIGCDINWLDKRLSKENISNTILTEFKNLYPLYELMKDK
ncbi:phospholipase D-like domain-containing protein [Flavobacterium sp. W1B]|uniref:phospholipase D-like domain-containing protein n=1 Tax=Flavobacterium sp. W1B TaxID=3394146 RepID=UPI0039BD70DF